MFDENYDLPNLEKVESYIQANKHLPEIPSAKEVQEQGIAVSEMLAKHMQKIEELTLYVIKLNNENESLRAKIADQDKQLMMLKHIQARIEALERKK